MNTNKQLTFADVKQDQFFICGSGWLCQKIGEYDFSVIADSDGNLYALHHKIFPIDKIDIDITVKEILPITKLTKEMLLRAWEINKT